MIIAIDGPSAVGKSTVARDVAKQLGFYYLDTGAMYRAVGLHALLNGISLDDGDALGEIASTKKIRFEHVEDDPAPRRVFIDGVDVTEDIRTSGADHASSVASTHPQVRKALVEQQQRIGNAGNYVVEGRDIGTTVFPDAEVKVFLTADAEERAMRRVKQNRKRGIGSTDYDEILEAIRQRDNRDSTRTCSPLVPADDAIVLNSTYMSISEVVDCIVEQARAVIDTERV